MLKVTEAFGGIGSQRRALQALGIPFEVVEYIDFDKYCVTAYNAMYDENFEPVDITKLERLKPTDLLTYSFPCQDISTAGLGKGIIRGGYKKWSFIRNRKTIVTSPARRLATEILVT